MSYGEYRTVSEIAEKLGCNSHNVAYIIRSRGIKPTMKAGNVRLFSEAVQKRIAGEIQRINDVKCGDDSVAKCTVY